MFYSKNKKKKKKRKERKKERRCMSILKQAGVAIWLNQIHQMWAIITLTNTDDLRTPRWIPCPPIKMSLANFCQSPNNSKILYVRMASCELLIILKASAKYPTSYNRKYNVLSASLNQIFPLLWPDVLCVMLYVWNVRNMANFMDTPKTFRC